MTTLVKKRVQYTVDQAIMESAEYIMTKVGLTPATVMSMVYAEIARTGKIPVTTQVSDEDLNTARLIAMSHNVPSVKVSSAADAAAFLKMMVATNDPTTLLGFMLALQILPRVRPDLCCIFAKRTPTMLYFV